jgi:hypothetical protein
MTIRSALVCLFLGLGASGCGSGTSGPLTATQFGERYKFSNNTVPGWTQAPATDSNAYNVYDGGDELVTRLDGGDMYTSNGCRVSMYQDLVGPNQETNTVVAMDFVTATQATAMFQIQQQNGATISITGYDPSVALASSFSLGGETVYAHFKASYFELWPSGFTDATSAGEAAKQFLDILKGRTN